MSDPQKAEQLKEQGNAEFKNGNFLKAAGFYTKALKEDPENVVLYSNRCAALLKLSKMTKALVDAERVISMRPDWEKGYFRKASIYEAQELYAEALEWYKRAAECSEGNRDVEYKIKNLSRVVRTQKTQEKASVQSNGSRFSFDANR